MSRKIGSSPFLYNDSGKKVVGVESPDGTVSTLTQSVPTPSAIDPTVPGISTVGRDIYTTDGIKLSPTKFVSDNDGAAHINIAKNVARTFRINQGAANVQESHILALEHALSPLIASSAWPKIRELWVPLGANLTGALTKIKYPAGNLAALANLGTSGVNPFVAGDYDPYIGITGNGTTKFLNSDAVPVTLGMTNRNLGIAIHTTSSAWTGILGGCSGQLWTGADFASTGGLAPDSCNGVNVLRVDKSTGMNFVQATLSTGTATCGANGLTLGSNTTTTGMVNPTTIVQIGALTSANISNAVFTGYALFDAMTTAELTTLSNFFQQINTAIGRMTFTALVSAGDSITLGPTGTTRYSYYLSQALGLTEVNSGASGLTMSLCPSLGASGGVNGNGKVDYIQSTDGVTAPTGNFSKILLGSGCLYTLGYGMNDASFSGNVAAFDAAYRRALDMMKLAGVNMNTVLIVGITYASNIGGSISTGGYYQGAIQSFLAAEAKIASDYGCMYTRMYDLWNASNSATYLNVDGIHPIAAGHQLMSNAILATVQASYPRYKPAFVTL